MPNENMPFLRELHFPSTTVPVIRQVAPLPEPEQPNGGHRLIYYMLGGALRSSEQHRQYSQHCQIGHQTRALSPWRVSILCCPETALVHMAQAASWTQWLRCTEAT